MFLLSWYTQPFNPSPPTLEINPPPFHIYSHATLPKKTNDHQITANTRSSWPWINKQKTSKPSSIIGGASHSTMTKPTALRRDEEGDGRALQAEEERKSSSVSGRNVQPLARRCGIPCAGGPGSFRQIHMQNEARREARVHCFAS